MNLRNSILLAFLFVIIANLLFFNMPFGIGTGILFLILNIIFFLFRSEKGNIALGIASSVISVMLALLIGYRSNEVVQFINFLAASFFLSTALYFYKLENKFSDRLTSFFAIPLSFADSLRVTAKETDASALKIQKSVSSGVIRGLLIAVPLLLVFFLLFVQADAVFEKLVERVLSEIGPRTIFSIIMFLGVFFAGITLVRKEMLKDTPISLREGKLYELVIVLGSVLVLFTVFMFIQVHYLFGNPNISELKSLGIESGTYSEYVRQGFFELLIASIIATSLIVYVLRFVHLLPTKEKIITQILSSVLLIETGLLLLSALRRVSLYEGAHGLTRARIFGIILLIWLAVILAILLFHLLKKWGRKAIFYPVTVSIVVLILGLNVLNIDGLIATKYRPTVNNEIDYVYILQLSPDAYEGWDEALIDVEKVITDLEQKSEVTPEDNRKFYYARGTLDQLQDKLNYLDEKYTSTYQYPGATEQEKRRIDRRRTWQAFSYVEYQAHQMVSERRELFDKVLLLRNKIPVIEQKITEATQQETQLDRNLNAPLTQ